MSLTIEIKDAKGAKAGTFDLPAEIFDVQLSSGERSGKSSK